jgi:AGCS family alanine or glycine:cation symporter
MDVIINFLNGIIWSPALIYLCLGAGLYFSIRTRFMQVRGLKEMLKLMFKGEKSPSGISSFQALAMSLSGRVGTGNIAGVATAIAYGGPGAVFWMWVVAFLGASTAYVESTLGQIYKEKDDQNQYRGGPAYYIEKAMGVKWYAWVFAISTVIATGMFLPGIQANSIADGVKNAWGIQPEVSAAILVFALAFIIFGGVKRIAKFAEFAVPFMAFAYILVALVIVGINAEQVPQMFSLIINSAFSFDAGMGATIGMAIQMGVKRGIYSNEAGQGTGPHPAAAAEVSHPAKQGYVQAFSVYIDTLFVCTATAFMLISTNSFNVLGADGQVVYEGLAGVSAGAGFTQAAVESVLPGFGASFVALALIFFCFTTLVAYYYMAESNIAYINRVTQRPWLSHVLKVAFLGFIVYGTVASGGSAWGLGDVGVGLMAWLNIIAIIILQKPALACLKDYEAQKKAGLDPIFEPQKLGIKNAELWDEIKKRNEAQGRSAQPVGDQVEALS